MFRYPLHHCWLLALCALGCAGTGPARVADAVTRGSTSGWVVAIEARAQNHGTDEWRPLSPEDSLHSGDHYAVTVLNSQPLYLYVARGEGDQPSQYLFPKEPSVSVRTTANAETRVPADSPGIELDTRTGEEHLYLVAAEQPLPPDKLKEVMQNAPAGVLGKGRERPPDMDGKSRGPKESSEGDPVYIAKSVSPGIFALRFTFQHQK